MRKLSSFLILTMILLTGWLAQPADAQTMIRPQAGSLLVVPGMVGPGGRVRVRGVWRFHRHIPYARTIRGRAGRMRRYPW